MTQVELLRDEIRPFNRSKKYSVYKNGTVINTITNKSVKHHLSGNGYYHLYIIGLGKVYLHRILAETFIPNPENKLCVNHKDGNKLNNDILNLEWCTHSENNKHAYLIGLKVSMGRVTGKGVINNKTGEIFQRVKDAAKHYGLRYTTLIMMLKGKNTNKTNLQYL